MFLFHGNRLIVNLRLRDVFQVLQAFSMMTSLSARQLKTTTLLSLQGSSQPTLLPHSKERFQEGISLAHDASDNKSARRHSPSQLPTHEHVS